MIVAVIAPTPHLRLSSKGDFYFVLAQRVLNDKKYREFYAEKRDKKKLLILDNGAFEKGKSLSTDDVLKAADIVHANEVVAPDYPFHGKESLKMTEDFISVCPTKYGIVGIPQGETPMIVVRNYVKIKHLNTDVIGLSILWHKRWRGIRPHIYHYIKKMGWWDNLRRHHLFGLDSAAELYLYDRVGVRSVDTSLPISLAALDMKLDPLELPLPHVRAGTQTRLNDDRYWLALDNIRTLKRVAMVV